MRIGIIIMILCFSVGNLLYAQSEEVNVGNELERLRKVEDLPRYDNDTKILQFSSYDTTGGNDDGFSGKYSFIRKNPDSSLVIFDAKGNGVINRIWTPTPTEDTLDFYFGGSEKPSFTIKFSDLFSGDVYPFVEPLAGNEIGGFYNYFPIPYENGCRIVFRGEKLRFYQIQYRQYPDNYDVKNFSQEISKSEKEELKKLTQTWREPKIYFEQSKEVDTLLRPGERVTIAEFDRGGRILGFTLQDAKNFEGLNKQVDLKVTWDNEKNPAINLPLADFFGYAFGKVSMQSLLLGSKKNINYCYFPMPFSENAKLELVNRYSQIPEENQPFKIKAEIFYSNESRDPAREGKFYSYWNRNIDAPLGDPHVILKGSGKGHYVGTVLFNQGLIPGKTLFFEGDDVTYIDGERRIHGTGSEDYFNGGWYGMLNRWDQKVGLPIHGSLGYSLPYSRTGGYRIFISDKMPFNSEIIHTIEHGPENNNLPVDYTSLAFYYADANANPKQPSPSNDLTGTYIPETFIFYPHLLQFTVAGEVTINKKGIISSGTGGQVRINLNEIPKGEYNLYADIGKMSEGAEISLWQRQEKLTDFISFYSEDLELEEKKYLSDLTIDDFRKSLTVKFRKDNRRTKIDLKRLILVRKKKKG